MTARYFNKLYGSSVIAAYLIGQRRIPFLPREKLNQIRDARIRRMVSYAAKKVPFYHELFKREGIDHRDIRGASDLDRLGVIDRETVRTYPHLFIAQALPARKATPFLTSGSTGIPVEIHHDRRSMLANIAFGEREREPVNKICGGEFRPKELYVGYQASTFKKVTNYYRENTFMPLPPMRRFVSLVEPIEKIAALTREEKPDILVGYGGWIDLFFKTIKARGLDFHRPKMVMYMGEALPPGARAHIEHSFGIPVLSRYNAVESFKIGYYCEEINGFHIHEDICHLRIADSAGSTVAHGEHGQIVISNLINRGTVLLNYPIGDTASLSERRCPCGRTFTLMSELEGRIEDILLLSDGRYLHPRAIWEVFKPHREILQYQVIQLEPARFRVHLHTVDEPAFHTVLSRTIPNLQILLGADSRIETARLGEMDLRGNGKFRAVSSMCFHTQGN